MRERGVEKFVFCSYAHKPGMARELNGWLAQTARDLGPGAYALATVHLDDPDPAGDMQAALDDGCIGLKVHENVQRLQLDDPRFERTLAAVAAAEGFVLVHVGAIPWSTETNNGPRRIAEVLRRHPTLRIVVAHFGVPDSDRYLDLAASEPRLFLDTTMVFASESPMHRALDPAAIARGARQIVYGTDWPNIPHDYDSEFRGLQALGLDDAVLHAITSENARRLTPALA
jgi:hypothetical protein